MKEESWTLESALPVIRRIAEIAEAHGFALALYGSVLIKGQSDNDLDLYFLSEEVGAGIAHVRTCVDAIETTLPNVTCFRVTDDSTRIQFSDGKRIDGQFFDLAPLSHRAPLREVE